MNININTADHEIVDMIYNLIKEQGIIGVCYEDINVLPKELAKTLTSSEIKKLCERIDVAIKYLFTTKLIEHTTRDGKDAFKLVHVVIS